MIVTYNRRAALERALKTLGNGFQVLVVDNGSTDGTSSTLDLDFPDARFIRLPKNFGFTKALNVGIRAADGEYVLLLHDDALISGEAVTKLADYLETRTDATAVSPLLVDDAGTPMPQVRPIPTASAPDGEFVPATGDSGDCILGAATMYRLYFLRAIRQIDESYGTYGPDIELGWQVSRSGKKNAILRDVTAVHLALPSPAKAGALAGDRASGTAAFLGIHSGMAAGLLYRLKAGLLGILTFRFGVVSGVFGGVKIDGTN